ncbi:hypothetical protein G7Y79_00014g037110 [Physcia stellaris]|nr:hypothetical protein G7Y79_00014g037110 [Physcia stellaris]
MSDQGAYETSMVPQGISGDEDQEMTDASETKNCQAGMTDLQKKFITRAREKLATKLKLSAMLSQSLEEIWGILEDILPVPADLEAERLRASNSKIAQLEDDTKQFLRDKQSWQNRDLKQKSEIQHFKGETDMLLGQNQSLNLQNTKLINELATLKDTVTAHNSSLAQLEHELVEKKKELGKLHSMIVRSRPESDAFDDHHFTMAFGTLQANIQNTVKGHFDGTLARSELEPLNSVTKPDDRDLFLQSYIAKLVAWGYFSQDAGVFGLERDAEESQARFETQLRKHEVSSEEITNWRIQTIKIGKKLNSPRSVGLTRDLTGLPDKILSHKRQRAKEGLRTLARFAYDLALQMRQCRTRYEWAQTAKVDSFDEADFDRIEDYNTEAEERAGSASRVLFGPLYKHVDGRQRVLLRKGVVLFN